MGINDNDSIFLTQEEHDIFLLSQTEVDEEESEQQAFENAIMEVHRQYNLRSKKSNDNPTKKDFDFKKTTDTPAKKVLDNPQRKTQRSQPKEYLTLYQKQLKLMFPPPTTQRYFTEECC
jgi:hypothetical protein